MGWVGGGGVESKSATAEHEQEEGTGIVTTTC